MRLRTDGGAAPEHTRRFAEEHHAVATDDAASAMRSADVIVTATTAHEPILKGRVAQTRCPYQRDRRTTRDLIANWMTTP
jgi:ornithine cyclodeaminase/alanine dehydrogenase-like protein (mu-crystallin family)